MPLPGLPTVLCTPLLSSVTRLVALRIPVLGVRVAVQIVPPSLELTVLKVAFVMVRSSFVKPVTASENVMVTKEVSSGSSEVSLTTIPLNELQLAGAAMSSQTQNTSEPVYRVRVRLDAQDVIAAGRLQALKPGMQLSASLVLEHRTLVEWVLEPLFGITGRL